MVVLFLIAYYIEGKKIAGKGILNNPYIYALSLAVYCTAWTFYGSVGKASKDGFDFLAVYMGPTLVAPIWVFVLRKIIRICKTQRITSIADFISSRYGKNVSLASIITVLCFLGVIPYISLQLKAIAESFEIIVNSGVSHHEQSFLNFQDTALYVAIFMAAFTVLFGTRRIESSEQHSGMVAAIAFESIVKLLAFLSVGIYVTWYVFDGFSDIFSRSFSQLHMQKLFQMKDTSGFADWFWITLLSGIAATLLPRQFQVAVVENTNENHLKKAIWLFPLYLLLINVFVLPIAFGGNLLLGAEGLNADYFVLDIPLLYGNSFLALIVFLGGFAAATSMIIVETIALSTMFSNHLVMPILLGTDYKKQNPVIELSRFLLYTRRIGMVLILGVAYAYYHFISQYYSLVSIGLISFVSVAQLAPSIIGGLYWKKGNKKGAISGLIAGFLIWFYTLVLPSLTGSHLIAESFVVNGPMGLQWLNPNALFGMKEFSPIVHALFFSLLFNIGLYILVSVWSKSDSTEQNQAEIFVDIFKYEKLMDTTPMWKGIASIPDMESLLANFLGELRSKNAILNFAARNNLDLNQSKADPKLVAYVERVLAGIIGAASARIMLASVVKEEEIKLAELLDILKESQQLMMLNRELKKAKEQLESANIRLTEIDELKDDFLATVTHELRTPITSIRAFSEILYDNPDIDLEERQQYLLIINKETDRLSRLISQVLDLEKYDSGKQKLNLANEKVPDIVQESVDSIKQLAREKDIQLDIQVELNDDLYLLDKDKIMQVMINLLSNAVKFTEAPDGLIQIVVRSLDHHLEFVIKDNGKGIQAEYQQLIFEKFFQARNQTIRKPKGSGLGLAICKKIIDLHGGEISVLSETGKGATFVFTIPILKEEA
ncbi:MAG: ATP-binding protein [Bacteroidia bacterium]